MTVLHALWAVLKGIWLALDGLRKVLHLILLLVLFGVLLAASQSGLPYVPDTAALVLAPNGYLVEELSGDPLDRALSHATGNGHGETRLRDLVDVVDRAKAITGRIDLVHANDSRDAFDSGADRHANFGSGQIDPDVLVAVVAAAGAPVVCETPGGVDGQSQDIAFLREHLPH